MALFWIIMSISFLGPSSIYFRAIPGVTIGASARVMQS